MVRKDASKVGVGNHVTPITYVQLHDVTRCSDTRGIDHRHASQSSPLTPNAALLLDAQQAYAGGRLAGWRGCRNGESVLAEQARSEQVRGITHGVGLAAKPSGENSCAPKRPRDEWQLMLGRYYSASHLRFGTTDPIYSAILEDPQTHNKYIYVLNNPLNGIDVDGKDTFRVNRKLGSESGPPVSAYNPLSHSIGATTGPATEAHPNGVVEHTSSWVGGQTTLDDPTDMAVAQLAIDGGLAKNLGDEALDPYVEAEMQATQDSAHPSHHPWGVWRTCKGELRRLVKDAKKKQKQESGAKDAEDKESENQRKKQERRGIENPAEVSGGLEAQGLTVSVDGASSNSDLKQGYRR